MKTALAAIGACIVLFGIAGALGLTEFRLYVGPDPKAFCERANK